MQAILEQTATGVKAKLFRGLADVSRLKILESLRAGPLTVSEVVAATGLSQPNVSGHLTCLHDCGLVNREQRGRQVFYFVADSRVEALLIAADALLTQVGDRVYICTRYEPDGQERIDERD